MNKFHDQGHVQGNRDVTALGHFLSSLAHDMRNEIIGVMISIQALEARGKRLLQELRATSETSATPVVGEVTDLLADVQTCHQNMSSTVSAMTRLLESERMRHPVTLSRREVALRLLMQDVVRSAARADRSSGEDSQSHAVERIKVSCAAHVVLWTDPDLLRIVLVNLIGNAIKHAPTGEIRFSASLTDEGRCEIAVGDRGPGISEPTLKTLFKEYGRGGQPGGGGFGLGLFIARRAADLLNGKLRAESRLGHGSCFTLELYSAAAPRPARKSARREAESALVALR